MRHQNDTFRKHARAPFVAMLNASVREPALLNFLDAPANRKGHANENLARELMELFTLGVGHYSEQDVRESARALTGWKVKAWAMGHGTKVGQGEAEVTTKKDLLVRMQAPRFFVQKDEVVLSANVHNYLKAEKRVKVALEAGELKGILWHQGESDATDKLADGYEKKLHDLIDRLRRELKAADVPFIAGQLGVNI